MKTNEFISKVGALGHEVEETNAGIYVKNLGGVPLGSVSKNRTLDVDTACSRLKHPEFREELFELLIDYARTPIEERDTQLTDAERVILENLNEKWEKIGRYELGSLYLQTSIGYQGHHKETFSAYNHLFQFIRTAHLEPYNIKELLG